MKVFISWSGEYSREVAELFKIWLKCVLQASDPWVSSQDIQNGSWWFNEIGDQLSTTTMGIVCLTQGNKDKPWILFETGALTKGLSTSRVCPFLIDLEAKDLTPPLSQLNLTVSDRPGVLSLVKTINLSLKEGALSAEVLSTVFDTYWPQFESKFNDIKLKYANEPDNRPRDNNDILSEVLSTVRSFDRRLREIEKKDPSTQSTKSAPQTTVYRQAIANMIGVLSDAKNKGMDKEGAVNYATNMYGFSDIHVIHAAAFEVFG